MYSYREILIGFYLFTCATLSWGDEGNFLHISDVHYDPFYGDGVYPTSSSCSEAIDPAQYPLGNHHCDSPWALVESVFQAMADTMTSETDFIVWTGDTPGAIDLSHLNTTKVLSMIQNVTSEMRERLPADIRVFPAIGNHDNYPRHILDPAPNEFRDSLAEVWDPWLANYQDANDTFKSGGYYVTPINGNLWMVVLNTAMYYYKDPLTEGIADPAGQFDWLEDTLEAAQTAGKKVFINAHILPGSLEGETKISFQTSFNVRYLEINRKYSNVIKGQFFGHHHYDSFRILYDDTGLPINALYVQPSVTPRQTPAPRNPSFRMVTYDRDTGDIIDIHQYYLDISMDKPTWELEYRATEAYNIADLSPVSLDQLVDKFSSEESSPDAFERYYLYNTVMASAGECDEDCRKLHICAITKLDIPEYEDCIAGSGNVVRGSLRTVILLFIVRLWQSLMS
ncbi:acid sphingomyelinase-like phosphodiesterase 3b [Strongylocentrotus purpuratus]|uniref:Sphingomyelin phosphodiesterase n=1 Tax=Strongylocentrotus purpuratus TaxID=7668 RepID=A0A7M7RDI3_STRPU|nr:acid sphingomyelinase-like phosphodiesterase 3b [Strongylocentrotus purpuratus]|eukprot:XP_786766.1 PREDICTED: acid sphingomyelinase-like phosphodiesterase 3b [Strongylocentrotus purpuratus]